MRGRITFLVQIGAVLSCVTISQAAVVFVDGRAAVCGDGQSWSTAYKYLQDALAAARIPGSTITEIWVAAGTYQPDRSCITPTGTGDRAATFELINGVAFRGGFAGTEDPATFDLATRNFETNTTILSGDLAGNDGADFANNEENSYHVTTGSGTTSIAILDGLTISGGNANGSNSPNKLGAGMLVTDGNPTLINCTFSRNATGSYGNGAGMYNATSNPTLTNCTFNVNNVGNYGSGGAICNSNSSPTLTNCIFIANVASSLGGGVYNRGSNPTLTGCTFVGNVSGGMYNYNSSPTLTNCVFSGNSALTGGGMCNYDSNPTLTNCTFLSNSGSSSVLSGGGMHNTNSSPLLTNCTFNKNGSPSGGGMYISGGTPRLTNCTFSANFATSSTHGGGGIHISNSNPTLTNCRFIGNRLPYTSNGAGMYNSGSNPILINCLFTGNVGDTNTRGGAIYSYSGNPTLTNCTLAGNSAASWGGGIYSCSGSPTLTNCILWGNSHPQIHQDSGSATVTYSCVQGGFTGPGNIDIDPRFLFLGGNLSLRRESPCIDAGNNTAVPAGTTTDLGDNLRFVDDPETPDIGNAGDPPGSVVDMGAYEYESAAAERLYVNAGAAPGGNGRTWATAYKYLQDGLTSAMADPGVTEIWVAGGVYTPDEDAAHPNGTSNRLATFQLLGGVSIYGGFPGYPGDEGNFSVRSPLAYKTTLSGDLSGSDGPNFANNGENSYHVVTANAVGLTAVLDGVIVCGGNANGSEPNNAGGGIYAYNNSSPSLNGCTFTSNSGEGMYISKSNPMLSNCAFSGNAGFGMANSDGNLTLTNCTLSLNGGGMYTAGGSALLVNCTVSGNSSQGIYSYYCNTTVRNCVLWNNGGDSLYQYSGTVTASYSCIQGGWSGTGNIGSDPQLVYPARGDLRISHGSPCIDAGSNAAVPAMVTTDLAGNSRFGDDPETPDTGDPDDPPSAVVDMGAYEYQPVSPRRLYVNSNAASAGDGQSWSTPYAHLQDALAAVDPGVVEIWVAGGVYRPDRDAAHPNGSGDRSATFRLPGAVATYGGFPGQPGQEGNFSVRNPAAHATILSGDLTGNDGPNFSNNGENSHHVVTTCFVGPAVVLDGLLISGGNANGVEPSNSGGGIFNAGGSPTLVNCTCRVNSASQWGGGIYSYGKPRLTNCIFIGNSAYSGGAIYIEQGNPTLANCTFSRNIIGASGFGYGGAVHSNGALTLANCILWQNTGSQFYGSGAITYSCVEGGWTGTGNIDVDPGFINAALGNLRLSESSPCIDAGDSTALAAEITTDLDGNSRLIDNPGTLDTGNPGFPPGAVVDMGAYEYDPAADQDQDGVLDHLDNCPRVSNPYQADSDGDGKGDACDGVVFVNDDAAPGGNGSSWGSAYRFLQDALTAAWGSSTTITEIWVAAGTYQPDRNESNPNGTGDRTATFQLQDGVSVFGGFAGSEDPLTFNLDDRNLAANETTLSGDLAGNDGPNWANNTENSYHVVTGNGMSAAAILDGVTVKAGNSNGNPPNDKGGGIYNEESSPTLRKCAFKENWAKYGGGLCNYTSSYPELITCMFAGNTAQAYGGGMYNYGSIGETREPKLQNCTFQSNRALQGGALYNQTSGPSLTDCSFQNNVATAYGGGIRNYASQSTLTRCSFSGNIAWERGGAIRNTGGSSVQATDCSFVNNVVTGNSSNSWCAGGAIANEGESSLTLTRCGLVGNQVNGRQSCVGFGGAIDVSAGSLTLIDCLLSTNVATSAYGYGGAVNTWPITTTVTISGCTIFGNSAGGTAGGVLSKKTLNMTNCIVWGNNPSQIDQDSAGTATITHSCIQGGWSGTGNVSTDPLFVNAAGRNLRLRPASPCIDAGNNAAVPAGITIDLEGYSRFIDDPAMADTGSGTAPIVDMGAYEYDPAGDYDNDTIANAIDNCVGSPNTNQADGDGDGSGDVCDNCPAVANPDQTDADHDNVGEVCDNCPTVANADQSNTDGDSMGNACDACPNDPLNDQDHDGVCGDVDNCPAVANADQKDTDHDGVGDVCDDDRDGDGVPSAQDNCPDVSNADQANGDQDAFGDACDVCPNDPLNDNDHDGVCHGVDNCPTVANAGQADTDGDGVGDVCDQCPHTVPGLAVDANGCPAAVPGDFDRDGDVDLGDFGHLQVCLKGGQVSQTDPNCQDAKLNGDNYVDQGDVGVFLQCMSGSGIPGNPNCADMN